MISRDQAGLGNIEHLTCNLTNHHSIRQIRRAPLTTRRLIPLGGIGRTALQGRTRSAGLLTRRTLLLGVFATNPFPGLAFLGPPFTATPAITRRRQRRIPRIRGIEPGLQLGHPSHQHLDLSSLSLDLNSLIGVQLF
jgi:hypothetical protein